MKGIYVLIIDISKDVTIRVGSLGNMLFKKGTYAYVGSAQNNVEKRIRRHMNKKKKLFWHIDYLLKEPGIRIRRVLYKKAPKTEECRTASVISKRGEAIPQFGCSDCKCNSHLFKITEMPLRGFREVIT
ncbi:MAG: GIY-YIG nuclease family protein [Candidatus Diapherotrites archaeon]|nr:GIY-YIG nuclease family protein [Candidatus Diapherotrites archaeon]